MGEITVVSTRRDGELIITKPAAIEGDQFVNDGSTYLTVDNKGSSPIEVTIESKVPTPGDSGQVAPSDDVKTVAANTTQVFGPYDPKAYNNLLNKATVKYSDITDVHVFAFRTNKIEHFVTRGLQALYTMELERMNLLKYSNFSTLAQLTSRSGITLGSSSDQLFDSPSVRFGATGTTIFGYWTGLTGEEYAGDTYTISVLYRADDGSEPTFGSGTDNASNDFVLVSAGSGVPTQNYTIEDLGGGIYRIFSPYTRSSGTSVNHGVVRYSSNTGSNFVISQPQLNKGPTRFPYVPTTDKQAVYDYSGNVYDGHLGSAGSAHINPITKALWLPGTSNNHVTTPDSVENSVTGDIDIRVKAKLDWPNPPTSAYILSKLRAVSVFADESYGLQWRDNAGLNVLRFYWVEPAGAAYLFMDSSTIPFTEASDGWVRFTLDVDDGAGNRVGRFYTSTDGETWTLLNTVTELGVTAIQDSPTPVTVGAASNGSIQLPRGSRIYRAQVRDGIDGPIVVDFNPADAHGDVSQFYSKSTDELWTINQSSTTANDPVWANEGLLFNDSEGDRVISPNLKNEFVSTDAFTIMAEITRLSLDAQGAEYIVDCKTKDSSNHGIYLAFRDANFQVRVIDAAGQTGNITLNDFSTFQGPTIYTGRKKSDGEMSIFVGESKKTTVSTLATGNSDPTQEVHIGIANNGSDPLNGKEHFAAFFNVDLTDDEIAQNVRVARRLNKQFKVLL